MTGPKLPKTLDLEEAVHLHREALHAIVVDMTKWLTRQRDRYRASSRTYCNHGHLDRSDYMQAHAIAFEAAAKHLAELKAKHKEKSARSSCVMHQAHSADGPSPLMADPTPEEIREACQQFQAGWTPAERETRSHFKHAPASTPVVKFGGNG